VPDEDLYEQGTFPSTFNTDHKHTFTIHKRTSWSSRSINVLALLTSISHDVEILKIELLNATFRYQIGQLVGDARFDQTTTPIGECAIEIVLKKRA
jgi:hypothetical protein